jgi:hypothetical protein
MYGNVGSITHVEYTRSISIGGFGSLAGGRCVAVFGYVGVIVFLFFI